MRFQSTLPRGERQQRFPRRQESYLFQSTLPRGERLFIDDTESVNDEFQSTLPRGERQQNSTNYSKKFSYLWCILYHFCLISTRFSPISLWNILLISVNPVRIFREICVHLAFALSQKMPLCSNRKWKLAEPLFISLCGISADEINFWIHWAALIGQRGVFILEKLPST